MEQVKKWWDNTSAVIAAMWNAIPQGGRDFLKGAAFGAIITAAVIGGMR